VRSVYGRVTPNQVSSSIANHAAGLNEYTPPTEITESHLTDCLDAYPYRDTAIKFSAIGALDAIPGTYSFAGKVYCAISDSPLGTELLNCLMISGATGYVVSIDVATGTPTYYDVTASGFPIALPDLYEYSACLYQTETDSYCVFTCSGLNKLIYLKTVKATGVTTASYYTLVTLIGSNPLFYPRQIVANANRIFAISTTNRLWWSKAGDPISWYGAIGSDSYINQDAGYWSFEKERKLTGLALIGSEMYVFGSQNIYAFRGYSYETFSAGIVVTGNSPDCGYDIDFLACSGMRAYYIVGAGSQSGSDLYTAEGTVYQFDGASLPTVISHPQTGNGASLNGIFGGITPTDKTHVVATEDFLYFFKKVNTASESSPYCYVYNIKQRSWWKLSMFNYRRSELGANIETFYVPTYSGTAIRVVCNSTDEVTFTKYEQMGCTGGQLPFIVTKAFRQGITDTGTLTNVILQVQVPSPTVARTIKLSCSDKTTGTDFTEIATVTFMPSGDVENIDIPVSSWMVSNLMHYRLKLEVDVGEFYLFNMERRFRLKGRSR
jgi:hypothetical protein